LFGENNHFTPGVLALEPPLVDFLDRNFPLQGVFLEEDKVYQPLVAQYYESGIMSPELEALLTQGGLREYSTHPEDSKLQILRKCFSSGIPIYFYAEDRTSPDPSDLDRKYSSLVMDAAGPTPDGVFLVIAGSAHVSRSPIQLDTTVRLTTGSILSDAGLPVLTILASGIYEDRLIYDTRGDRVMKHFVGQLETLHKAGSTVAIETASSPYRDTRLNGYNNLKGSDYDIILATPSETWHKGAVEGKELVDPMKRGGKTLKATVRSL
jgi:hypothetical protein